MPRTSSLRMMTTSRPANATAAIVAIAYSAVAAPVSSPKSRRGTAAGESGHGHGDVLPWVVGTVLVGHDLGGHGSGCAGVRAQGHSESGIGRHDAQQHRRDAEQEEGGERADAEGKKEPRGQTRRAQPPLDASRVPSERRRRPQQFDGGHARHARESARTASMCRDPRVAPCASRTSRRARSTETPPLRAIASSSACSPGMPRSARPGGRARRSSAARRRCSPTPPTRHASRWGRRRAREACRSRAPTPSANRDERQPAHEPGAAGRLGERDPHVVGRLLRVAQRLGEPAQALRQRRADGRRRPPKRPRRLATRRPCAQRSPPEPAAPAAGDRGRDDRVRSRSPRHPSSTAASR